MNHPSTGELRRLTDDSSALPDSTRLHVRACVRCGRRQARMAHDAASVGAALPDLPAPDVGVDLAWARLRRRLDAGENPPAPARRRRMAPLRGRRVLVAGAGSVVLLGATSAAAAEIVSVLTPTRVAPVQVGAGDISSLLGALPAATLTQSHLGPAHKVGSLAEAESATGLPLRLPAHLPAGVSAAPSFTVQPAVTVRIDFGPGSPPSIGRGADPSWLIGSTLSIQAGPAVLVTYPTRAAGSGVPGLVVAYSAAPVVTATGASPQSIEHYVLSRPGVSPSLAAEIRMLGAPGTVLPVPVPAGATVRSTTVGGSPAVVLTDPSGFGAGVIWEQGKTVGVVAGPVSAGEATAVADELG